MSLTEPGMKAFGSDRQKVEMIVTEDDDASSATFRIQGEDHTLLNALRYIIMKNPAVEFCAYSIPHPSEALANIRIQTDGTVGPVDVLHRGLDDLDEVCLHILDTFKEKAAEYKTEMDE